MMQGFHLGDNLIVELVPSCVALKSTVSADLVRGLYLKNIPGVIDLCFVMSVMGACTLME